MTGYVFGYSLPGMPYLKFGAWPTLEEAKHHGDFIMEECGIASLQHGWLDITLKIAQGAELLLEVTAEHLKEATENDGISAWHAEPYYTFVIAEYDNIIWNDYYRMTPGGDHRFCEPGGNGCKHEPKAEDQPEYPTDAELFARIKKEEETEKAEKDG